MADVADAIAAASAQAGISSAGTATVQTPPTSPRIKHEPPAEDAMIIDPEPPQEQPREPLKEPFHSTLKRSRSQSTDDDGIGEDHSRDEKRLKTEPVENDIVDIASLVQQAEASVMQELMPEHDHDDISQDILNAINGSHVKPDHDDVSDDILKPIDESHVQHDDDDLSQDILNAINEAQVEASHQQSDTETDEKTPPDTIWSNPAYYTRRKHIIPALGNLAVDILIAWSEQSLEDTMAVLGVGNDPDSEVVKEYAVLKSTFDAQRRLLSDDHPLLDAQNFNLARQGREVIRIVNLATLCASVFSTNEICWEELNEQFLKVFVAEDQALPQDAAELFLSLKTQIFLATLESEQQKPKDEVLDGLFTTELRGRLQAHHPNIPLNDTETRFIANAAARKAMLLKESNDPNNIQALSKQFSYEAFLDSLNAFINDNIETIKKSGAAAIEMEIPTESSEQGEGTNDNGLDGVFDLDAVIAEASRAAQSAVESASGDGSFNHDDLSRFLAENISRAAEQAKEASSGLQLPSAIASAAESASRATMLALQSIQQNKYHPTEPPQSISQTHATSSHANYHSPHAQPQARYYQYHQQSSNNAQHPYSTQTDGLPPNQSDTTPALYEKARQAAAARSSTHARREGTHSTRRPWSPEEEKALMMGLDMVKGPHWSQILGLFGPNGSMSNILADRTQVQLKDKARNLKLFFLKTNSEMPYYLHCVTGELKTRAPTQAARKEAEEKAKSEEQQAHMNGVLALAGGLQNHAPKVTPSATVTAVSRPATPGLPVPHPVPQPESQRASQPPVQTSAHTPAPAPRPPMPAAQPVYLPLPAKPQPSPQQPQQPQQKPSQQPSQQPQQQGPLQQGQQQQRPPQQHQPQQHEPHQQPRQQQQQQQQQIQKPEPDIKLSLAAQPQPQPHPRYSEQQQQPSQSQSQSEPQQPPQPQSQAQLQSQPRRTAEAAVAQNSSIETAIEQALGASLKEEHSSLSREEDALFDLKAAIERETANALTPANGTLN
ncbi:hypothetical protein DL764_004351 [Monosporascus ibericus]|uniref:HTH myb-type domain-containing protein n=1 Tax=Monosporascus ibericus TaxID=155417 RepID=A0A4Q4TFS4_9PEZI|nr:hypothetical protein DL764_004351 [Monosporascus ibericus]